MRRYILCPADSLLSREKDDHECQHGDPMYWENEHWSTSPHICLLYITWLGSIRYHISVWHWEGCHRLEDIDGRTSPHRTRSTESRWRQADIWGNLWTSFIAARYGSKVEGDMTTHHYQMWKFKIVDPIQYVWHAGDDDTTLYTTTLRAGAPPAVHVLLVQEFYAQKGPFTKQIATEGFSTVVGQLMSPVTY